METRELTIVVLGERGATAAAIERALATVRGDGVECDLIDALSADRLSGDAALQRIVRRCQDALPMQVEPLLLRVRLSAADTALVESLAVSAQEDLLVDPDPCVQGTCRSDAEWTTYACVCEGYGCVRCLGEGCP